MSNKTNIQWAHSTVNPIMGCDGCELYPTAAKIREALRKVIFHYNGEISEAAEALLQKTTANGPQAVMLNRTVIAQEIAQFTKANSPLEPRIKEIEETIKELFVCYAANLHRFVNRKGKTPGWAFPFEKPLVTPGRVAKIAQLGIPTPGEVEQKPWLLGAPRMIFVSDMGDALSKDISFETLLEEIIRPADSTDGRRHIWLWLTKRPTRMAKFSDWLHAQGATWPDNLVAMTSVTSSETVNRVAELKKVRAKYRGLSVEPLWSDVTLPLENIDWVIVGGESGSQAHPFHVEWAQSIYAQCKSTGTAFFLKQLGATPYLRNALLELKDSHGGDWTEWPESLRVREIPVAWRNRNEKPTATPCAIPFSTHKKDAPSNLEKTPRSELECFSEAETTLGIASKTFSQTTIGRQGALIAVCDGIETLKVAFEDLPKSERPEPTWQKYIKKAAPQLGLGFSTARQADNYIKLGKDFKMVSAKDRQEKLSQCCSYREMHSAIGKILQPKPVTITKTIEFRKLVSKICKLTQQAASISPTEHKKLFQQLLAGLEGVKPPEPTNGSSAAKALKVFTPSTVREISDSLGGQTALGRSVGKENAHASYWVRTNALPELVQEKLVQVFKKKGFELDLRMIKATANRFGKEAKN